MHCFIAKIQFELVCLIFFYKIQNDVNDLFDLTMNHHNAISFEFVSSNKNNYSNLPFRLLLF